MNTVYPVSVNHKFINCSSKYNTKDFVKFGSRPISSQFKFIRGVRGLEDFVGVGDLEEDLVQAAGFNFCVALKSKATK